MSGFSFSFSKKVQATKIQLVPSKLRDESTKEDEEERDFVTSVEGKEIKGTKRVEEKKKEWIIPLIKKNNWRLEDGEENKQEGDMDDWRRGTKSGKTDGRDHTVSSTVPEPEPISEEEALRRQAMKELLEEAGNVELKESNSFEIPLLLQNKVPAGFEEDDNLNVSLRAEQSTIDDYEQFPIEQFGKAMLRGMGWKEEEGIGKTNKSVVDLKEPTLRPKGLGLGAERPQSNKDTVSRTSSKNEEAKLVMKIGAYVKINKGPNKGSYGQIQSFDEDNNRVVVKLALNSRLADVSKFYIDVVPESEYKSKSKILNNEKYEEYKKIHDDRDRDREAKRRGGREDEHDERTNSRRKEQDHDDRRTSRKDGYDEDDYDRKSSRRRREEDDEERIRPSRRDDEDYDRKNSKRKEEDGYDRKNRKNKVHSDQDESDNSDDDQSRDRHRPKHKTDSSKSSSKHSKKHHKKEKKKKKKKHRRDSSTSSTSSSSSRSRSRHRKRN